MYSGQNQSLYNNSPYKESGGNYNESSAGFIQPPMQPPRKKPLSPWIKFGIPAFIVIAVAAVVGGVLATRKNLSSNNGTTAGSGGSKGGNGTPSASGGNNGAPINTATDLQAAGRFAAATNSLYMIPVYP